MYLTVCPPCGPGSIPGHGGALQGIFLWLITRAASYTVQGAPKSEVAPPWKKAHGDHEMPTDQPGLRISLAYGSAWTSSGRHWSTAKRDKKKGSRGLCERRWVTVKVWKLCELTHSHSETARLPRMPRMLWDYLWHWMGCSLSLALNGGLLYFKVLPGRKCIFCITLLSCAGHLRVENFSTCVFNLMRVRGQRNTSLWGELWDTLVGRALWDSSVDRA